MIKFFKILRLYTYFSSDDFKLKKQQQKLVFFDVVFSHGYIRVILETKIYSLYGNKKTLLIFKIKSRIAHQQILLHNAFQAGTNCTLEMEIVKKWDQNTCNTKSCILITSVTRSSLLLLNTPTLTDRSLN